MTLAVLGTAKQRFESAAYEVQPLRVATITFDAPFVSKSVALRVD